MKIEELTLDHSEEIVSLMNETNPDFSIKDLNPRLDDMFKYPNYICFGVFVESKLVAMTGGWVTTRLYSGKQLELDNVAVSEEYRSSGYGSNLLAHIEAWAIKENCLTVELNAYVSNSRSHKFYYNQGYNILGFHFQKKISKLESNNLD